MTEVRQSSTLSLGVCVLPAALPNRARHAAYADYIHEILGHAGVAYSTVSFEDLEASLASLRILVTAGESELAPELQTALQTWVKNGGAWLSIGGLCGMGELLGGDYVKPTYQGSGFGVTPACALGEGYLEPAEPNHPLLSGVRLPLHFFNGQAVTARADAQVLALVLDKHQRPTDRAAIIETQAGAGRTILIAPDVTGTVVRIQQGIAVTRDGVPASDGTSPVSDGVLKADDGAVLDWDFDRVDVPGLPGLRGFLEPIADAWRELLLRAIFHLATVQGLSLPVLWLYPRNLPALAHMSHDSDGNDPSHAERLLELVHAAGIKTTWCIIAPGYDIALLGRIRDAGHELATHYDALDHPWGEEQFDTQWQYLKGAFGQDPLSNKNHYTRWEGDVEFFEWCERRGIQLDQSKGVSKLGEIGFNFGTCHLYRPVRFDGSVIDVLEHPTMTQDLEVFGPARIAGDMLDAALRHHGVLHVLFHPAHTHRADVAAALADVVEWARGRGMEWWTARELNTWERARRRAEWSAAPAVPCKVQLHTGTELQDATLMVLGSHSSVKVDGEEYPAECVTRWGFDFSSITLDLREKATIELG